MPLVTHPFVSLAIVKRAKIDVAGSADIVAAVTGKKIRVIHCTIFAGSAETLTVQSGGSTALTGDMDIGANGGFADRNDFGIWETAVSQKLNFVQTGSVELSGYLLYQEVDG
jgi:hypothetical protein